MIPAASRPVDVFGLGAITLDFIGSVDSWPGPGTKYKLKDFVIEGGGLIGNALTAVARLGGKASIAGKLGFSMTAEMALAALSDEGIDTFNIIREKGCEPVRSLILTNVIGGERSIYFSRKNVIYPDPREFPDQNWIKKINVLLLDHGTGKAGLRAARMARKQGIPVVIDAERMEKDIDLLIESSDHIVVSREFAYLFTGKKNEIQMLKALQRAKGQVIIVTRGNRGVIGKDASGIFEIPSFKVNVVDTTGSGDVFHGVYAYGIARGWETRKSCIYANAAAAMSTTGTGGREAAPSLGKLKKFIKSQSQMAAKL